MKNMSRENVPNLSDYETYLTYHASVGHSSDGRKEDILFRFETKKIYMLLVEKKAKDRSKALRHEKSDVGVGKPLSSALEVPDYIQDWLNGFKKDCLEKLLQQYYVEGYDGFCLAVKPEIEEGAPLYKILVPECLYKNLPPSVTRERASFLVDNYFGEWLSSIRGGYGNKCMSQNRFLALIRKVRVISETYQRTKTIQRSDCGKLSQLSQKLPNGNDITSDFLQSVFSSLIEDLLKNELISQCQHCGDFFKHIREKKYCSFKSEGKNCGKSARNKRYYEKHKDEILPKARKSTKELKAFYKKMGVKK